MAKKSLGTLLAELRWSLATDADKQAVSKMLVAAKRKKAAERKKMARAKKGLAIRSVRT